MLGIVGVLVLTACGGAGSQRPGTTGAETTPRIDTALFEHHYVSTDLPGDAGWGYGLVPPADFDRDGDLDYGVYTRGDSVYWFENRGTDSWERHTVGALARRNLGGAVHDVDGDGWTDVVLGGFWYRNPGTPTDQPFERYTFDGRLENEIHDLVVADVTGDGREEVVLSGDGDGAFWYRIPEDPAQSSSWARTTITLAVLDSADDVHAGPFPRGVDDLDGDGDADVVMPDRWYENRRAGRQWIRHPLPFGSRGPWGLSSRSWITDLDGDGDADVVVVDADQTGSGAAWLENDGGRPPSFTAHPLPAQASGTRGSFHSLYVGDFDGDGDLDVFAAEQEDDSILPEGASPRWFVWENSGGPAPTFTQRVVFDGRLGAHDALAGDVDGDGDLDVLSKIWNRWPENANEGREHVDLLENTLR